VIPAKSVSIRQSLPFSSAVVCLLLAGSARADVSSWLFAGGGVGLRDYSGARTAAPAMELDTGIGSSPGEAIAVGGLIKLNTRFGQGSDFGLYLRTATGGYVRGAWGVAIDLGGLSRFEEGTHRGYGGTLSLGAPWGVTVNLDATRDNQDRNVFLAVVGIDFARFSVYRSIGTSWFPNPYPSPRK
jgi:hypothetical protein